MRRSAGNPYQSRALRGGGYWHTPARDDRSIEHFKVEDMGRLLGDDETLNAIKAGESLANIKSRWTKAGAAFEERRRGALLYGSR